MFGHGLKDRGVDGGAELRVGTKALLDGVVDERPELLFNRGVSGVCGNEDDFMVLGERSEPLALQGQELGLSAGGEDGVGELDPVQVEVKVSDGEGFVVDVGVVGRESLLSLR